MANNSKYINIRGRTKWVNGKFGGLFEKDEEYGNYSLIVYPDPESWDRIKKAGGLPIQTKTDDEGDFYKFRRPHAKILNGENVIFGRPKVFFPEGVEGTRDIGNGSIVEATVVKYKAGRHEGHRLESVKIIDLIKFERNVGGNPEGYKAFGDGEENASETIIEPDSETKVVHSKSKESDEVPFDDGVPFGDKKEEVKKSASPFQKKMSR